jgi:hypothetical protein
MVGTGIGRFVAPNRVGKDVVGYFDGTELGILLGLLVVGDPVGIDVGFVDGESVG